MSRQARAIVFRRALLARRFVAPFKLRDSGRFSTSDREDGGWAPLFRRSERDGDRGAGAKPGSGCAAVRPPDPVRWVRDRGALAARRVSPRPSAAGGDDGEASGARAGRRDELQWRRERGAVVRYTAARGGALAPPLPEFAGVQRRDPAASRAGPDGPLVRSVRAAYGRCAQRVPARVSGAAAGRWVAAQGLRRPLSLTLHPHRRFEGRGERMGPLSLTLSPLRGARGSDLAEVVEDALDVVVLLERVDELQHLGRFVV